MSDEPEIDACRAFRSRERANESFQSIGRENSGGLERPVDVQRGGVYSDCVLSWFQGAALAVADESLDFLYVDGFE